MIITKTSFSSNIFEDSKRWEHIFLFPALKSYDFSFIYLRLKHLFPAYYEKVSILMISSIPNILPLPLAPF